MSADPPPAKQVPYLEIGLALAAFFLTAAVISANWNVINQLPRYQYERLDTNRVEQVFQNTAATQSIPERRAHWLSACGHEFEQALLKSDLSPYPSRNVAGILNRLASEKDGLGTLYAIGFRLLVMERTGATAQEKWNTLGPYLRAAQTLEFRHDLHEIYAFWRSIYMQTNLDQSVAEMAAFRHVGYPHNAWLVFMDKQLTSLRQELAPDHATVCEKVQLSLLASMFREPAPHGLVIVAAQRLAELPQLPDQVQLEVKATIENFEATSLERSSGLALAEGLAITGIDSKLRQVGRAILSLPLVLFAGLAAFLGLILCRKDFINLQPAKLSMSLCSAGLGVGITIFILTGWHNDFTGSLISQNLRRPSFSWGDTATWWPVPFGPSSFLVIGITGLFTVAYLNRSRLSPVLSILSIWFVVAATCYLGYWIDKPKHSEFTDSVSEAISRAYEVRSDHARE